MSVQQPISQRAFAESIVLMLGGALCLAVYALFGQELGETFTLPNLVFARMLVPAVLVGAWYLAFSRRSWKGGRIKPHLLRAAWVTGSQYCFFYVLLHTSLLNATLLFMTSGLFVPLIGRVVLGQAIRLRTGLAIMVAFVGTVITLDPHGSVTVWLVTVGLFSGFFNASSQVTMHRASKTSLSALQIALCMYTLCAAPAFVIVLVTSHLPLLEHVITDMDASLALVIVLLAVFSVLNQQGGKPGSLPLHERCLFRRLGLARLRPTPWPARVHRRRDSALGRDHHVDSTYPAASGRNVITNGPTRCRRQTLDRRRTFGQVRPAAQELETRLHPPALLPAAVDEPSAWQNRARPARPGITVTAPCLATSRLRPGS